MQENTQENNQSVIINDKDEKVEITSEQALMQAVYHLTEAALFFRDAGFKETSDIIGSFAITASEQFQQQRVQNNLDKTKLKDEDYDKILSSILNGEENV